MNDFPTSDDSKNNLKVLERGDFFGGKTNRLKKYLLALPDP